MENAIFEIRDLVCRYKEASNPVLHIPALTIYKGQLVFVVGISGSGKSTFLESLGLMNNTIDKGSKIAFYPDADQVLQLGDVWQNNQSKLDDFRKKYLSFIFQQTNLMPNFSCGENMMITALMKGESLADAKKKALQYMEILKLREEVFDKPPVEVSGGQKQRIAFIRAICGEFSVLFGDEPTGHMDPTTAKELIQCLKILLKGNQKTGILVSHDLDLALRYADMIIPICLDPKDKSKPGTIYQQNILVSKTDVPDQDVQLWFLPDGEMLESPKSYLLNVISNGIHA